MAATGNVTKYDEIFLGILQNCGKIEPFLDAIFNFLSRRTDFFLLMHKKDDKLGFPPGYAEKMTIKIFEKYQERVLKNDPIYMKWKESRKEKDKNEAETKSSDEKIIPPFSADTPPVSKIVEIETTNDDSSSEQPAAAATSKDNKKSEVQPAAEEATSNDKKGTKEKCTVEEDCHNGGKTEKYCWSQTLTDVDVKIPIPSFVKASKDLSIEIKSTSLNVSLRNGPPACSGLKSREIIAGKLSQKIRIDESLWSLSPGEHVAVNLEKFEQKWWDGVFEGDEKIDKSSIDTTQQVADFDEQTQGDIRKVMYDQQQKMMGKPTSDEQKTHTMLEKAWDAEGSPFKGTPFDPSRVNLGNNGALQ